jgi:hypothetical protein
MLWGHLPREIDALKVGGPNPRLYLFAKSFSLAPGYQTNYRFVSPRSP